MCVAEWGDGVVVGVGFLEEGAGGGEGVGECQVGSLGGEVCGETPGGGAGGEGVVEEAAGEIAVAPVWVDGEGDEGEMYLVKVVYRAMAAALELHADAIPVDLLSLFSVWVVWVWGESRVRKFWG